MTRQRAAGHTPAHDPHAANRCVNCPHIFYLDDSLGKPCRWDLCECVDHRPAGLVIEPEEAPDAGS